MANSARDRLETIRGHLSNGKRQFPASDDDVVILAARRTAVCKAKRGSFKNTLPCDMLAPVLSQVCEDVGMKKELVGEICVGNVLQPGAGALRSRMAQFFAGFPETTTLSVVNRQCSSGLQAVMNAAGHIRNGACEIAIGAGVESMSLLAMGSEMDASNINPKTFDCKLAIDCTVPMGITSENVAERYGISKEDQDRMSMQSHQKAAAARARGNFKDEIVPITTSIEDKEGNTTEITVTEDDGIRSNTTMEGLAKLKPAFKPGGSTTAGNSSQISDGAAAVLIATRRAANRLGIPIQGVIRGFSVVGVQPDEMGVGPAVAIPSVLQRAGLTVNDIDVYEINEAFASQALYSVKKVGIPMERVNPNGGAIALGHPLGCTGARQIATLMNEMKRQGKAGYGIVSMCIGTGMGAAAVIEYVGGR